MTRLVFGDGDQRWSITDPSAVGERLHRLRYDEYGPDDGQLRRQDTLVALSVASDYIALTANGIGVEVAVKKLRAIYRAKRAPR